MTTKVGKPRTGHNGLLFEQAKQTYLEQAASVPLAGEGVSWKPGGAHSHPTVIQALQDARLDISVAKDLSWRHAFTRALKKLSDERIVCLLENQADALVFQFNKRHLENGKFDYPFETKLTLNKNTGDIACAIPQLQQHARQELEKAAETRTTADITAVIQRLFEKYAEETARSNDPCELFPMRDQGGIYFVPQSHSGFVDKLQDFITRLGGSMRRWPIAKGTKQGEDAIRAAKADRAEVLIKELNYAIQTFGVNTRDSTTEAQANKIRLLRHKLSCWAADLGMQKDRLEAELDESLDLLNRRVEHIAVAKAADLAVACDFCGCPNAMDAGNLPSEFVCCECGKTCPLEVSEA